jgi:hypothetical protein
MPDERTRNIAEFRAAFLFSGIHGVVADDISAFTRIDGSTSHVGMKKAEPNTIIKGVQSFPFV